MSTRLNCFIYPYASGFRSLSSVFPSLLPLPSRPLADLALSLSSPQRLGLLPNLWRSLQPSRVLGSGVRRFPLALIRLLSSKLVELITVPLFRFRIVGAITPIRAIVLTIAQILGGIVGAAM
jgi:hypothetical protein